MHLFPLLLHHVFLLSALDFLYSSAFFVLLGRLNKYEIDIGIEHMQCDFLKLPYLSPRLSPRLSLSLLSHFVA